jgi:acetylornithine deacetylase/succinyl-diaminopimelate desuccinylase-like protein
MDDIAARLARLTADLVAIDSRSFVSNLAIADRIEQELAGFDIHRADYADAAGTPKRALIAHRGPRGGYALSGHMDTVPDTSWQGDAWKPRLDAEGMLHGLGTTDMKGPLAACLLAARAAPDAVPATLLITTDEETTKQGARAIAAHPFARSLGLRGIVVAEPTGLAPVRGHRAATDIRVIARGVQAHSSTGRGLNANWALVAFLVEMKALHDRLRTEADLQDAAYDPPFSDFNLVVDNHGTAVNVTVPLATARIKYRTSRGIDPLPVLDTVRAAAVRHGLEVTIAGEGAAPELPPGHPLVRLCTELSGRPALRAPYGTDAVVLQDLAPCVVLGPGSIDTAHTPAERVRVADLAAAVPLFGRILAAAAA